MDLYMMDSTVQWNPYELWTCSYLDECVGPQTQTYINVYESPSDL